MTIVIGYTDGASTWLAADRAVSNNRQRPYIETKIYTRDGWGLACSGNSWSLATARMDIPTDVWMQSDPFVFLRAWWKAQADDLFTAKQDPGEPRELSTWVLLARAGSLWSVYSDGYPHAVEQGECAAHGGGAEYAAGVAWGLRYAGLSFMPDELLKAAVLGASYLSPSCGLGVDIVELSP